MRTDNITIVAKALHENDHAYVGIRPADATPAASAPAFILQEQTLGGFSYQLEAAANYWPKCSKWALIASDYASADPTIYQMTAVGPDMSTPAEASTPHGPPGMRVMAHPVTIAEFNTES
jgi:hypothetical protein